MEKLAQLLRDNAETYRDRVHRQFFLQLPEARQIFSLSLSATHSQLAPALAWFFDHCDPWGTPSPEAFARLERLALDHRRHGFPPQVYETFTRCLIDGLDAFELSPSDRVAAEKALELAAAAMADAAHAADVAGTPPVHQAQVVSVHRPNREVSVVRLEATMPVGAEPGQHFAVTTRLLQGHWVFLTPADTPTPTGQMEFHVWAPPASLSGAALLARAKVGEYWQFGEPQGAFPREEADVFICFGTGWAAVRAHLMDLIEKAAGEPHFTARVYAHAGSPGQHYDAITQDNLKTLGLELTRLVSAGSDPALLGASAQAGECVVSADAVATVLERESTDSRFVLVGPAHAVDSAQKKLAHAGAKNIEVHPWDSGRARDFS